MAEGLGVKEPGVEVGGGVLLNQEPEKGRPRNLRSGRQVVLLWEPPWQGVPCQTRGWNILSLDRIYNFNGNKRLILDFYWVKISGDWIVFKGDLGRFYFCQRGNREFCCPTPATVTAINGFLQLHHDAPNLSLQNNGGAAFGRSWWDLGLIFWVHHHTGTCWVDGGGKFIVVTSLFMRAKVMSERGMVVRRVSEEIYWVMRKSLEARRRIGWTMVPMGHN